MSQKKKEKSRRVALQDFRDVKDLGIGYSFQDITCNSRSCRWPGLRNSFR